MIDLRIHTTSANILRALEVSTNLEVGDKTPYHIKCDSFMTEEDVNTLIKMLQRAKKVYKEECK